MYLIREANAGEVTDIMQKTISNSSLKKNRNLSIHKSSLKKRLVYAFFLTSVIPVIISSLMSYYNSSRIVNKNMDELMEINIQQTRDSLKIWLESYEDLLYQIYTDDDIITLVDKINSGEDLPVTINQLRRTLRGLLNTKEYLRGITIFTENGSMISYNQLTAVSSGDEWITNFSLSQEEFYNMVSMDNDTHFFGTEYATTFASEDYYLFHLAHRMINYKKLEQRSAIVTISIDEKLLQKVCQNEIDPEASNSTNFIIDDNGRVISFAKREHLGTQVNVGDTPVDKRKEIYTKFINESGIFEDESNSMYVCHDDKLNWSIIKASSRSQVMEELKIQQNILILSTLTSLIVIISIIILLTEQLTGSIRKVVEVMGKVGKERLSVRIDIDKKMPIEIETIATQFNDTLGRLEEASENEKIAERKQRDAEITALEAQINPHFLYNTLDTINWMAIDKGEFEISNGISSLATILRYAIDNSKGVVKVKDEVEWLKKYIFLQQIRLKNAFRCNIYVEPDVYDMNIHKLLLQPFVENAIIHGFDGVKREHELTVDMKSKNGFIEITINDNGKGIPQNIVEQINKKVFKNSKEKSHIGLENAITRIHMYYANEAKVQINSAYGEGTEVIIKIPREDNE